MPSELFFEHLTPQVAGNCFVETICTASQNLWGVNIDSDLLLGILKPYTNEYHFRHLMDLLNNFDIIDRDFDVIETPNKKGVFRSAITSAISGGAFCVLTVNTKKWVRGIRKYSDVKIDSDEIHAILVYGYYRPSDVDQNTWYYIYDPYDEQNIFLNYEKLFSVNYKLRGKISIGIVGLSSDFANILEKYPTKEIVSGMRIQNRIYQTLPGTGLKRKLSSLLSRKRASRRRN